MIDSHCHLDLEQYDADRADVVKRAELAGVTAFINPGADAVGFDKPIKMAEQFENVFASVGVHPEGIKDTTEEFWLRFAELLKHPKVIAVGEVGLERNDRLPSLEMQILTLRRFVQLANENKKPLVLHIRYVHQEFQKLLQDGLEIQTCAVMHSFTGTADDAKFYLDRGFYLGIAGMVTFPNADDLRAVVKDLPLERLLVETDAPFLAPQVVRGKRNEPAYVVEVAKKIAEIKSMSLEEVEKITEENTKKLFGI